MLTLPGLKWGIGPINLILSARLSSAAGIEHGFGTRNSALAEDQFAKLRQIHSNRCLAAKGAGVGGEGDALLTNQAGLAVSIRTADCFPILLADPVRRVVAAIHAGWRGTAARITSEAIRKMKDDFGTRPGDVVAAIGPGIGVCCYEVGEDVGRRFGLNRAGRLDLAQENRRQLQEAGVPEPQIEVLGLCTFCDHRFHSWRRDKEGAGRMISFIRITRDAETPRAR